MNTTTMNTTKYILIGAGGMNLCYYNSKKEMLQELQNESWHRYSTWMECRVGKPPETCEHFLEGEQHEGDERNNEVDLEVLDGFFQVIYLEDGTIIEDQAKINAWLAK